MRIRIEPLPGAKRVLMSTSDIPLAGPEAYAAVLTAFGPETDLGYVIVRHDAVLERYADRPAPPPDDRGVQMPNWVTVELRDGRFTGTPVMVANAAALERLRPFLKSIFDDREMGNVVRTLGRVLGWWLLARVALALRWAPAGRMIAIAEVEHRMSRGLRMTSRGWVSDCAELAFDIDHLTDLPLAERELSRLAEAKSAASASAP